MVKYETTFAHIVYDAGESREMAIGIWCNKFGQHSWQPFSVDYEKGIIFFTRKINPDREEIENYG